jgi:hypothetical protein
MRVDLEYFLDGLWDDEGGVESAFDCQDYAFGALDADG